MMAKKETELKRVVDSTHPNSFTGTINSEEDIYPYFEISLKNLPDEIYDKIFSILQFVRASKDIIDVPPVSKKEYLSFKKKVLSAKKKGGSDNEIIDDFIRKTKKKIDNSLLKEYLSTKESLFNKKRFRDLDELADHMHGSSETLGLMISRVLGLKKELDSQIRVFARSIQYINMLKNVEEASSLKRRFIPMEILKKFELDDVDKKTVIKNKTNTKAFKKLMRFEIKRYFEWKNYGETVLSELSSHETIAFKLLSDIHGMIARKIYRDPLIVFNKKIRISRLRIRLWLQKLRIFHR